MMLEELEIKLPQGDKEKLQNDIYQWGTGWLFVTEGNIGERIDPMRIQIKPETK